MKREMLKTEFGYLVRFGLVGIAATAVHMSVSLALATQAGIQPQIANLCAFLTALFVSFFGHYHFTFRSTRHRGASFLRFIVVAGSGYLGSAALIAALAQVPEVPVELSLVAAALVIPAISFVLSRLWVY